MPPKGKDKPKPVEARAGEEVRCIEVRAEGRIVDRLTDPVLCLQVPGEEGPRRSEILTECEDFEGAWRKGDGALVTLQKADEGFAALCEGDVIWRTTDALKVGDSTHAELKNPIGPERFTWLPVTITAGSTCNLTVGDEQYLREGRNAFAFATTWFRLEGLTVTTEAIKSVLSTELTLQVVTSNQSTRSTEATAVSDQKKSKGKAKPSVVEADKTSVHDAAAFSLVPLLVGHTEMVVRWEEEDGAKTRQPLCGFSSLKLTITTYDEAGARSKLLTPLQETRLMPMCFTVVSAVNIPDSRPVAISKSEDPLERPLVDTISRQTPQYDHLSKHCHDIHVSCAVWPNSLHLSSHKVRHEQSPGIHYHCLFLLGEIAAATGDAIPDTLGLIKYLFEAGIRLQLHDRDTDAAPGFGVANISLRPLLFDDSQQPTLRLQEQVASYRTAIDVKGDDEDAVQSSVSPGQYMSWGTTVALKVTLAAPLPKLSFRRHLVELSAVAAACVASLTSLPVALMTDPESEPLGCTVTRTLRAAPEAPVFTRLVVRLSYKEPSTQLVLHAMMQALLGMEKVSESDDVNLHVPKEAPPPEVEEPDPKKKGKPPVAAEEPPPARQAVEDGLVHVKCSNGVSGFELIDGVHRVFVFEGMTWALGVLLDAVHTNVRSTDLRSGAVSIAFNPTASFPSRAYHKWPPLVADIPSPRKAKRDDTDAGGVGGRIRRLRLQCSLREISNVQRNYVKRRVSEGVFRSIKNLTALCTVKTMQAAMDLSLFPSASDVVSLERMYGTTLSTYDVCAAHTFHPFTQPLAPEALVPALQPERDFTPGSLTELQTLIGCEVIIAGRPAGPVHGRRAEVAAAISLRDTSLCWLYVPQLNDTILLLMTKMPKPVKTVSLEVEGKVVDIDGTPAVQVYRWQEASKGYLHGTISNTAFLAKKRADSRRLGYSHYRSVQQEVARHKKNEEAKRERAMRKALEESSSSDEGRGNELVLPPVVPPVAINYKYLNATKFKGTRKQKHLPLESVEVHEVRPPRKREYGQENTAFQQLKGGWMAVGAEDLRKGVEVRLKDGSKHGKVTAVEGTMVTLKCKGGEVVKAVCTKLLVNAKCSLLDNSHGKKPTANRIEDLTQGWVPQGDPFERKTAPGRGFVVTKTNRPFSPVARIDDKAVDAEADALRRKTAARKEWWDKMVVDDAIFKVDTSKRNHPIDRHQGLLIDTPTTKSLKQLAPEPPPLSIHKPAAANGPKQEVSTVYYPGKSHKWGTLDNKDKQHIKPLLDSEKTGPHW